MSNESRVLNPPLLTEDLPGVGGDFSATYSDFSVEEIPRQTYGKKGNHFYFLLEKEGLTTAEALQSIAKALGKKHRDIGYAGLKDAHAVTRQWISMEQVQPERVCSLSLRSIRILKWARHDQPLRIGQLKGNRFRIRLRQLNCPPNEAVARVREIMAVLSTRGMPNAFGPQRFGNRLNGHLLGQAVLLEDRELFLDLQMGDPRPEDNAIEHKIRSLYQRGQYAQALKICPGNRMDTRRVLRALVQHQGDKRKAFGYVAPHLVRFLVSAYQSYLFNQVLYARMSEFDRLLEGDIAYQHGTGDCFPVEDLAAEQARCQAFEISPSGPIYSVSMSRPTGPAGEIENKILAQEKTDRLATSAYMKKNVARGGRRPLRIQPTGVSVARGKNKLGTYLELRFDLPSGCYATVLLREVMKSTIHLKARPQTHKPKKKTAKRSKKTGKKKSR